MPRKKSTNIELYFEDAKFLVILPGNNAAHDMEIAYEMNPNTTPVATVASNVCHWIMNGDDEEGNSVNCDYFGVEEPGWMYTLDKDSVPGSGSISCADVFAIHGWWMVLHFKNIAVWEHGCPTVPDIAFTTY
jgi:hypothetical protein